MAQQVAGLIDLAQYRQRKASEAARAAVPMQAVWPMPLGVAFSPFIGPFAFWVPVWIPVLMDGWSLPEHGDGDA